MINRGHIDEPRRLKDKLGADLRERGHRSAVEQVIDAAFADLLRRYRGARLLETVVKSALGNADFHECPDMDALVVVEARVDEGPMFKRIRPRARGTAFMIKRRMAHITVVLADPDDVEGAAASPPAAATA